MRHLPGTKTYFQIFLDGKQEITTVKCSTKNPDEMNSSE